MEIFYFNVNFSGFLPKGLSPYFESKKLSDFFLDFEIRPFWPRCNVI